jgi:hypothetical protein
MAQWLGEPVVTLSSVEAKVVMDVMFAPRNSREVSWLVETKGDGVYSRRRRPGPFVRGARAILENQKMKTFFFNLCEA